MEKWGHPAQGGGTGAGTIAGPRDFGPDKKLELIGRLAGVLAHDIKNGLAELRMGIDYFLNVKGDAEAGFVLDKMVEALQRIDFVILELLEFSITQEPRIELRDLHEILNESLQSLGKELESHGVRVEKELAKELVSVPVDLEKIERVFQNILLNAVQAMPQGGTIGIKTYLETLSRPGERVGSRREDMFKVGDRVAVVEIEDTGTGIREENLDKVFEPFFTTKQAAKRPGLGLSICAYLVELHRGTIQITNRPEGGARVKLRFTLERRNESDGKKENPHRR